MKVEAVIRDLNKELSFIYGMEDGCEDSKLDDLAYKAISDYAMSGDYDLTLKGSNHYELYNHRRDFLVSIYLEKQNYKRVEHLKNDNLIASLKRKSLVKEYKKEFKSQKEDFELVLFYVIKY